MDWPTEVERGQIERALAGAEVTQLTIKIDQGSPWLRIDVWVHLKGDRLLALWRATGAVYEVGHSGAVNDEPIIPPGWGT